MENPEDINKLQLYIKNIAVESELKDLKEQNHQLLELAKELSKDKAKNLAKISTLENSIEDLKRELGAIDLDDLHKTISELREKARDSIYYKNQFEEFVKQKDWVHVNQFDRLHWGDNYPALKVLFNYLQRMNALTINWSYFASKMDYGNMEPINLNTYVLSIQDIGYLLAKIKPFFLDEFTGKAARYNAIIARKFTIDGKLLDKPFFKKYLRPYNSGKKPNNLKRIEIDDLVHVITKRYH